MNGAVLPVDGDELLMGNSTAVERLFALKWLCGCHADDRGGGQVALQAGSHNHEVVPVYHLV